MKKFKFVFVSTLEGSPWGGSEELWSQAACWLAENGHTVSASVRYWSQARKHIERLSQSGILIQQRKISFHDFVDYGIAKLTRSKESRPPGYSVFRRWIRSQKPDLVCFSDGGFASNPFMMSSCYEFGFPYVSLGQMNSLWLWPLDEQLEKIRFGFTKARKVFFVSKENMALAEFQIGMRLPHAETIWNPFNVSYEANPEWPDVTDDNDWELACVGRLETKAKGQDLIFRVLAEEKWRSRPIHITLYGSGPNEISLKCMSEMLGIQNRVTFAGHVEDVEKVWAKHHALILPSRYEGMPLALLEAMLCNRMAIVTDLAGTPEVMLDGKTGFLMPAPSFDLLDSTMEKAWSHRHEWQSMGIKAGQHIRSLIPREPAIAFAQKLIATAMDNR